MQLSNLKTFLTFSRVSVAFATLPTCQGVSQSVCPSVCQPVNGDEEDACLRNLHMSLEPSHPDACGSGDWLTGLDSST